MGYGNHQHHITEDEMHCKKFKNIKNNVIKKKKKK